jgi:4-amino-4-deoxy-L-arabinose transferase-like glycosyltransferase
MSGKHDRFLKWALIASVMILFFSLGHRALWDPDEGRYAEMAREVLVLNDWVTPHLNYLLYFEKPMMHIWLLAISFKVLGISEWAARLVSIVAALGGAALTGLLAWKMWGQRAGLIAALSLLTSAEYFILANVVDINITLTLFITGAMVFFWLGQEEKKPWYFLLSWASMALAVLTKGPIGVILPGGAIFLYILFTRQFRLIRESRPVSGMLLFLAIALPWYILVSLKNPDFFSFFFINQNISRYASSDEHNKPFYFFLTVIAGGAMPWAFLLPSMIRKTWVQGMSKEVIYILTWFFVILLFFTPSHSKLATYILPCFSPLALMAGYVFKDHTEKERSAFFAACAFWVFLGAALTLFPSLVSAGLFEPSSVSLTPLMHIGPLAGAIVILGSVLGVWLGRRYDIAGGFAVLGITVMIVGTVFSPQWDEQRSTKDLVEGLPPDARLCTFARYYQSSSFYAKRQVVLVDAAGELEYGIRKNTDASKVMTLDGLSRLMGSDSKTYCIITANNLSLFRSEIPRSVVTKQVKNFCLMNVPSG